MKKVIHSWLAVVTIVLLGCNLTASTLNNTTCNSTLNMQDNSWRYFVGCKMGIGGNVGSVYSPVFKVGDDFLDFNYSTYIGPTFNLHNDLIKISSGVLYSVKNMTLADHTREVSNLFVPSFYPYKNTFRYRLINLPLLFGYNFGMEEDFEAELYFGPSYSFIVDRKYTENNKVKVFETVRLQDDINGFWNYIIGFSVGSRGHFTFGIQYEHMNINFFSSPKNLKANYHAVTFDLQFRFFGTKDYR